MFGIRTLKRRLEKEVSSLKSTNFSQSLTNQSHNDRLNNLSKIVNDLRKQVGTEPKGLFGRRSLKSTLSRMYISVFIDDNTNYIEDSIEGQINELFDHQEETNRKIEMIMDHLGLKYVHEERIAPHMEKIKKPVRRKR